MRGRGRGRGREGKGREGEGEGEWEWEGEGEGEGKGEEGEPVIIAPVHTILGFHSLASHKEPFARLFCWMKAHKEWKRTGREGEEKGKRKGRGGRGGCHRTRAFNSGLPQPRQSQRSVCQDLLLEGGAQGKGRERGKGKGKGKGVKEKEGEGKERKGKRISSHPCIQFWTSTTSPVTKNHFLDSSVGGRRTRFTSTHKLLSTSHLSMSNGSKRAN